jgi:hypothetical protein
LRQDVISLARPNGGHDAPFFLNIPETLDHDRPHLAQAVTPGVPADIDVAVHLAGGLDGRASSNTPTRPAYSFMGKDISYAQTDSLSQALRAYLQGLGLPRATVLPS